VTIQESLVYQRDLLPATKFLTINVQTPLKNRSWREVYSIQPYVIKFVSELRQVGAWFSPGIPVSSTNKTDRHDMTEILSKVALNTINPNHNGRRHC
jgi:hypothetical protein